MALFTSLDGVDSNGHRAEVNVQVGTGRVKDVVGRGHPNDEGVFRNVEVVFDPDNPLLKRKVYAMLDTTAQDLFKYVQEAQADQRTVLYRIESQRKRGVDRSVPFADLKHSEDVVRILAAVDDKFSHEAKTDPEEDPDRGRGENPSALAQRTSGATKSAAGGSGPAVTADGAVAAWESARRAGVPRSVLDVLAAQALAAGADPVIFAADTYSSDAVAAAADAEQFALDHLVAFYSQPPSAWAKPRDVEVVDVIFAQAAALALELLNLSDEVQVQAAGVPTPVRGAGSHRLALRLVCDSVDKRHSFPLGETGESIDVWRAEVVEEAVERLRGVASVAAGVVPGPETAEPVEVAAEPVEVAAEPAEPEPEPVDEDVAGQVAAALDATIIPPHPGEPGYVAPSPELVNQLKAICAEAGVLEGDKMNLTSRWFFDELGISPAPQAHGPVLEKFVAECVELGPEGIAARVNSYA